MDPKTLADELHRIGLIRQNRKCFFFRDVTEIEIKKVVSTMKSNSCGVDQIGIFFIKSCISSIGHVIADMCNFSLKEKIFPDKWKVAIIKPIPKVNNPSKLKDFMPISLLTTLSKIFEKLVADQMKKFSLTTF